MESDFNESFFLMAHSDRKKRFDLIPPDAPFKLLKTEQQNLKNFCTFSFSALTGGFRAELFARPKAEAISIMRRLGGISRRHRIVFEIVSNFLVEREGWHGLGRKTGRAPIRGQQIVWKIQAEFGLLKRKKRKCAKIFHSRAVEQLKNRQIK